MSQIRRLTSAHAIDKMYLNNSRRRARYDVAVAYNYKFPFRVFAKVESTYAITDLHELVQLLNEKFQALKTCGVPVDKAYDNLLQTHSKKVCSGIDYETGLVKNKRLMTSREKDTTTSNTEGDATDQHEEVMKIFSLLACSRSLSFPACPFQGSGRQ